MRYFKLLAVLALAVASTGCLRLTFALSLKPDGSGTIATTFAMTETMMQQAGAMMGATGGTASVFPTEAQMREASAAMGGGTRFVSATPYKTGGFEGVTALYAFDDVNKLQLNMEQALAGTVNSPQLGGEIDPKADIKLSFTREGDRTVLVIGMPEIPAPDAAMQQQAQGAAQQAESPEVAAMMKQMMGGLLMEVTVNVQGQILKTNAPFVEGSRVVLMRLDGDQLLKSGQGLGPLLQMGESPDFANKLAKVPGLKLVTLPQLRIEFK